MVVTIPVLRAGLAANIRQQWECPNGALPEPLIHGDFRVDPGKDVKVVHVSFASIARNRDEPWVVVWVDVEVPDGSVVPIQFQMQNPKHKYKSPESVEMAKRRMLDKNAHAKPNQEIIDDYIRRAADSVPDEVSP